RGPWLARATAPKWPTRRASLRQRRAGASHVIVTAKPHSRSLIMKQTFVRCLAFVLLVLALPATAQVERDDPAYSWNLEHLFADVDACERERQRILTELERIAAYQGTLGDSSESLHAALRFVSDTYREALKVYVYASLQQDEDLRNTS